MKKLLTILLALAIVLSTFATMSFAEEVVGEVDLLAESGYGDPKYLHDNSIDLNCSEWDSHCNWQTFAGYLGFLANGYPIEVYSTREAVETTLSNGETGYAIKVKNATGRGCFAETALENMDILCGSLTEGQKYRVQVVAKVMEGPFDVNPSISINEFETVPMTVDSAWHTYNVDFTYNSADATETSKRTNANWDGCYDGAYKDTYAITLHLSNLGVCYDGTEIYYESIKVFEINEVTPTGDSMMLFVAAFSVAIAASVVLLKKKAF